MVASYNYAVYAVTIVIKTEALTECHKVAILQCFAPP